MGGGRQEAALVKWRTGAEILELHASSANAANRPGDGERAPRLERRRRSVKINSEGRRSRPGVSSRCSHRARPGAAPRRGEPGTGAARLAGSAKPERPAGCRPGEASQPPLCLAAPKPPSPRTARRRAGLDSPPPAALETCRVSGARSVGPPGLHPQARPLPEAPGASRLPESLLCCTQPTDRSSPPSSLRNIKGIHINNRVFICC